MKRSMKRSMKRLMKRNAVRRIGSSVVAVAWLSCPPVAKSVEADPAGKAQRVPRQSWSDGTDGGEAGKSAFTARRPEPFPMRLAWGPVTIGDEWQRRGVSTHTVAQTAADAEGPLYGLRLNELVRCGDAATASVWMAAEDSHWTGVVVEVTVKAPRIYVSPRDFSLVRDGVIVPSQFVEPPALPKCLPLLFGKQVRKGESVRGVVLFAIPQSVRNGTGPTVLVFSPSRWGGARRLEIGLPDCLDTCRVADQRNVSNSQNSVRTVSR